MGTQFDRTFLASNMKSFTTIAAFACLAISTSAAPQNYNSYGFKRVDQPARAIRNVAPKPLFSFKSTNSYDSFGIPTTGDHIKETAAGSTWDTQFGKIPFSGKNFLTREQRATWLPIMKATIKVMETPNPDPRDVNDLLVMSRDLMKDQPQSAKLFSSFGGGFAALEGIEGMGLPKDGDVIETIEGVAHIVTEFGSFPLSETSLMTDEERERFLPVSRTFTSILEKDTLDVREMNLLLKQSRELTNELQKYGTENGFGDGSGTFGALGALAQGASTPLRRTSGGSSDNFNQFGIPTDGDQIINVQGQGASFNTQFGKFPLGKNRMSAEQRQQWLPVMEVLVKVMEASTLPRVSTLSQDSRESKKWDFLSLEMSSGMSR